MKLHSASKLITNSSETTYTFATTGGAKRLQEMLTEFLSRASKSKKVNDFTVEVIETKSDMWWDWLGDTMHSFLENNVGEFDDKTTVFINELLHYERHQDLIKTIEDYENNILPDCELKRLLTKFFTDEGSPENNGENHYFEYDYVIKFADGSTLPVGSYHDSEVVYC